MKQLVLILLLASPLYGVVLPNEAKIEAISDFSGGLNTLFPSHKLSNQFTPYSRNVFIDNGKIERINGFVTLGSSRTLMKVTGIFPYAREDGSVKFLVTDSSITLETSDFRAWVAVSSRANTGSLLNCMQVRNKMWCFNGLDFPFTWDGTNKVVLNGLGGTPNVPKFKYGAYYLERVWGFSVPNSASDMYFTSVITTDNVIIAPDDSRAWPSINNFSVGSGDGQIGTALWTYQGQLKAGKESSIYSIFGDDPSNFKPRKEETSIGVISNDSVKVMDGDTHFLGQDGIYRNIERVSDLIDPDIALINKGVTNVVSNIWETQVEFNKGQFFGTTAESDGSLYAISPGTAAPTVGIGYRNPVPPQPSGNQTITDGTTYFGPILVDFGNQISSSSILITTSVVVNAGSANVGAGEHLKVIIENTYTGVSVSSTMPVPFFGAGPGVGYTKIEFSSQAPTFEGWQINQGSYSVKFECAQCPGGVIRFAGTAIEFINATFFLVSATTGQFISETSTIATVNAWGNFDSIRNTNGGTIDYFVRTSTSSVNITTQPWQSISPGAIIDAPVINKYIQWASTIQSVSNSSIDNVVISHIEGQSSDARAFAMDWKNRYWLAVTTTSDNTRRLIYVKSKITNTNPNAWMAIEGPSISCFAKYGNFFYGGAASTGTVYRLDYGTNFDGSPIYSVYDTPDMTMGDNYFDKSLYRILVDGQKASGGTINLRYSLNQGTFQDKPFSINGTGRYSHIIEGVRDNGNFKTLRLRIENGQLDTDFITNNLSAIYTPTRILTVK